MEKAGGLCQVTGMKRVLVWMAGWMMVAQSAWAGLVWDAVAKEFAAQPGETRITVPFTFRVEGERIVRIREVETSCGCTVARPAKDVYEPGERGTLEVAFLAEGRTGPQKTGVKVVWDDGKPQVTLLEMTGTIPEVVRLEPRMLLWKRGEPLEPRQLRITLWEGFRPRLEAPAEALGGFAAELKEDAAGWYLEARPPAEGGTRTAAVVLRAEHAEYPPVDCRVFLLIRH